MAPPNGKPLETDAAKPHAVAPPADLGSLVDLATPAATKPASVPRPADEISHDGFFAAALPAAKNAFTGAYLNVAKLYEERTLGLESTVNSLAHKVGAGDVFSAQHLSAKQEAVHSLDQSTTKAEEQKHYEQYSAGYWGNAIGSTGGKLPYYAVAAASLKLLPQVRKFFSGGEKVAAEVSALDRAELEVAGAERTIQALARARESTAGAARETSVMARISKPKALGLSALQAGKIGFGVEFLTGSDHNNGSLGQSLINRTENGVVGGVSFATLAFSLGALETFAAPAVKGALQAATKPVAEFLGVNAKSAAENIIAKATTSTLKEAVLTKAQSIALKVPFTAIGSVPGGVAGYLTNAGIHRQQLTMDGLVDATVQSVGVGAMFGLYEGAKTQVPKAPLAAAPEAAPVVAREGSPVVAREATPVVAREGSPLTARETTAPAAETAPAARRPSAVNRAVDAVSSALTDTKANLLAAAKRLAGGALYNQFGHGFASDGGASGHPEVEVKVSQEIAVPVAEGFTMLRDAAMPRSGTPEQLRDFCQYVQDHANLLPGIKDLADKTNGQFPRLTAYAELAANPEMRQAFLKLMAIPADANPELMSQPEHATPEQKDLMVSLAKPGDPAQRRALVDHLNKVVDYLSTLDANKPEAARLKSLIDQAEKAPMEYTVAPADLPKFKAGVAKFIDVNNNFGGDPEKFATALHDFNRWVAENDKTGKFQGQLGRLAETLHRGPEVGDIVAKAYQGDEVPVHNIEGFASKPATVKVQPAYRVAFDTIINGAQLVNIGAEHPGVLEELGSSAAESYETLRNMAHSADGKAIEALVKDYAKKSNDLRFRNLINDAYLPENGVLDPAKQASRTPIQLYSAENALTLAPTDASGQPVHENPADPNSPIVRSPFSQFQDVLQSWNRVRLNPDGQPMSAAENRIAYRNEVVSYLNDHPEFSQVAPKVTDQYLNQVARAVQGRYAELDPTTSTPESRREFLVRLTNEDPAIAQEFPAPKSIAHRYAELTPNSVEASILGQYYSMPQILESFPGVKLEKPVTENTAAVDLQPVLDNLAYAPLTNDALLTWRQNLGDPAVDMRTAHGRRLWNDADTIDHMPESERQAVGGVDIRVAPAEGTITADFANHPNGLTRVVDYTDPDHVGTRVETYKALTDAHGNITRPAIEATFFPDHTTVLKVTPDIFEVTWPNGNLVRSNWVFDGNEALRLGWPESEPNVVRETVWNGKTTRVYADGTQHTRDVPNWQEFKPADFDQTRRIARANLETNALMQRLQATPPGEKAGVVGPDQIAAARELAAHPGNMSDQEWNDFLFRITKRSTIVNDQVPGRPQTYSEDNIINHIDGWHQIEALRARFAADGPKWRTLTQQFLAAPGDPQSLTHNQTPYPEWLSNLDPATLPSWMQSDIRVRFANSNTIPESAKAYFDNAPAAVGETIVGRDGKPFVKPPKALPTLPADTQALRLSELEALGVSRQAQETAARDKQPVQAFSEPVAARLMELGKTDARALSDVLRIMGDGFKNFPEFKQVVSIMLSAPNADIYSIKTVLDAIDKSRQLTQAGKGNPPDFTKPEFVASKKLVEKAIDGITSGQDAKDAKNLAIQIMEGKIRFQFPKGLPKGEKPGPINPADYALKTPNVDAVATVNDELPGLAKPPEPPPPPPDLAKAADVEDAAGRSPDIEINPDDMAEPLVGHDGKQFTRAGELGVNTIGEHQLNEVDDQGHPKVIYRLFEPSGKSYDFDEQLAGGNIWTDSENANAKIWTDPESGRIWNVSADHPGTVTLRDPEAGIQSVERNLTAQTETTTNADGSKIIKNLADNTEQVIPAPGNPNPEPEPNPEPAPAPETTIGGDTSPDQIPADAPGAAPAEAPEFIMDNGTRYDIEADIAGYHLGKFTDDTGTLYKLFEPAPSTKSFDLEDAYGDGYLWHDPADPDQKMWTDRLEEKAWDLQSNTDEGSIWTERGNPDNRVLNDEKGRSWNLSTRNNGDLVGTRRTLDPGVKSQQLNITSGVENTLMEDGTRIIDHTKENWIEEIGPKEKVNGRQVDSYRTVHFGDSVSVTERPGKVPTELTGEIPGGIKFTSTIENGVVTNTQFTYPEGKAVMPEGTKAVFKDGVLSLESPGFTQTFSKDGNDVQDTSAP